MSTTAVSYVYSHELNATAKCRSRPGGIGTELT
jgi:hypothetical protein